MSTPISKRQQARNERQLQDLIQTVPGNDRCADCAAKNPGWASWNLGIFLCVRCASLHRKLGTHVSKVKSLSMDAWSTEQVENMKKMGNVRSNAVYNPQKVRADIPIDADEVDSAVERFIRQKYESKTLSTNKPAARHDTGSTGTGSWNDEPPPLPPKPKKFPFNFRSASSTTHRQKQDFTPPASPDASDAPKLPKSKPSQVFGMKITGVSSTSDQKLAALREMGFSDNRKNAEILKSANGNLDKAVETLIRLGEGSKPLPSAPVSEPLSPDLKSIVGLSAEKVRPAESKVSNNPWEIPTNTPQRSASQPAQPVNPPPRSQSAGPAVSNSWNPFAVQPLQDQAVQGLNDSFQGLHMSHTGPSPYQPQYLAQPIPEVPQIPQQYQNHIFQTQQAPSNAWQAQPSQTLPPLQTNSAPFSSIPQGSQQAATGPQAFVSNNPFMPTVTPQTASTTNPWAAQLMPSPATLSQQSSSWASQGQSPAPSPAVQQASNLFQSVGSTPTWPQQQTVFQQSATASPAPMTGQQGYFYAQQQQPQPPQLAQNPGQVSWQQAQQQNVLQQQMGPVHVSMQPHVPPARHDKSSILALYNMPHLAPVQPVQTAPQDALSMQPHHNMGQRSATMPLQPGTMGSNPFMAAMQQPTQSIRHVSNESVDFVNLGGGRHSPDAFAGLSAQYMR